MPKMKTHRGAAKRFKRTARGKIKRRRASSSHLLTKKSSKRRRLLRQWELVHPSDMRRISPIIP